MSADAEKMEGLRRLVDGMAKQSANAAAQGAAVRLITSDSVIATLRGILEGASRAGAQAGNQDGETATRAILGGAAFAIGSIGYSPVEKP